MSESVKAYSAIHGDWASRALDALDIGVVVLSVDLESILYANAAAVDLIGSRLPDVLREGAESFIRSRCDIGRMPPAVRVEVNQRAFHIRLIRSRGIPPTEILILRTAVFADVDLFRALNSRYGVSRREYRVINRLRLGKTNRQIATELSLSEGTVARHVHRLLQRFGVANRTQLANLIEGLLPRRD